MPDTAAADAAREREPDASAADKAPGDAGAAAATTTPSGIGVMALRRQTEVGRVDDPAEKEAEAVAQRLMRATDPPPVGGASPAPPPEPVPVPGADATGTDVVRRQTATSGAIGTQGGPVPDSVQDYLENSRGSGSPLPEATRRFFESRFPGAHFGDVRIHDDPGANEAARVIGAVAFTRDRDVYFAAGMYDPVSESGRAILAHELTHVVQQSGVPPPVTHAAHPGAVTPDSPNVVRRTNGAPPGAAPSTPAPTGPAATPNAVRKSKGLVDVTTTPKKLMHVFHLPLPPPKYDLMRNRVPLRVNPAERTGAHLRNWDREAATKVRTRVTSFVTTRVPTPPVDGRYYLRWGAAPAAAAGAAGTAPDRRGYFFGTLDEIVNRARRPQWIKATGTREDFDVDHKQEHQLGGSDDVVNLWLLHAGTNRSVGSTIASNINNAIEEVLTQARTTPALANLPDRATVRQTWHVVFDNVALGPGGPGAQAAPPAWELDDLDRDDLTRHIEIFPGTSPELGAPPGRYAVYFSRTGGSRKEVDPAAPNWGVPNAFQVHSMNLTAPSANIEFYQGHGKMAPYRADIPIRPIAGLQNAGYLGLSLSGRNLVFNPLSPVEIQEAAFDPDVGIVGGARIPSPTVPLLRNTEIGLRLRGADVQAYATIQGSSLQLPGPFHVTGGELDLAVGLQGFSVAGDVHFEIRNLARGRIFGRGNLGANSGFAVGGELNFDTRMFTRANLGLTYDSEHGWGVTGELGVGEGKIAGIRSATARVAVEGERVSATGTFESSLRGLERGQLSFTYDPATGMEIAGTLGIGRLPGIEGGTIDARVRERRDGQGYSLTGGVTARPAIPGVTGSVTGRFEDGTFLAEADLGYQRGMLNGRVHLGITNQAVTNGRPAGPPTTNITAWGGGQVTIRIAPWLQGTIGLELDPHGRMTVRGEVALPDELTVFDEKRLDRNIFSIGVDIPIVGVAVAGQRVGIFATIRGGLDASAGFGPGKLRALSLAVTYSPDDEAATRVQGRAEAYVPAHAGLRLFVQGGIGAGIPLVSATAGLEISGGLGLEGAAQLGIDVAWTPTRGLVIDTRGEIFVEPKFRFAIAGFVDVHADLWVTTIDLYKRRWQLAAFEYGSNLRFGVLFPVHYEEGQPFQLPLDQVQFSYPHIDPQELLRGLIARVA